MSLSSVAIATTGYGFSPLQYGADGYANALEEPSTGLGAVTASITPSAVLAPATIDPSAVATSAAPCTVVTTAAESCTVTSARREYTTKNR